MLLFTNRLPLTHDRMRLQILPFWKNLESWRCNNNSNRLHWSLWKGVALSDALVPAYVPEEVDACEVYAWGRHVVFRSTRPWNCSELRNVEALNSPRLKNIVSRYLQTRINTLRNQVNAMKASCRIYWTVFFNVFHQFFTSANITDLADWTAHTTGQWSSWLLWWLRGRCFFRIGKTYNDVKYAML